MGYDWLPGGSNEKLAMARRWVPVLKANGDKWNIPEGFVRDFETLVDVAELYKEKAESATATSADKTAARTALSDVIAKMRLIKKRYFFLNPLTPADFTKLDLVPPDETRTDHFIVTEIVDFVIFLVGVRLLGIRFWVKGRTNRAKPKGYDGAVVVWGILDEPPASPLELNRHKLASRTPFIVEFEEHERGKTVYFCLYWQNERGHEGPYSEILSAIIP